MIRPLYDRLIVKRASAESKTKSGIFIPDTAKEKPIEGEVIAVGNGKITKEGKIIPIDVKIGDRIIFGKYSGSDIKIDGIEYVMMKESDVIGIIE